MCVHCRVRPSWPSASCGQIRNSFTPTTYDGIPSLFAGCGRPRGPHPAVDIWGQLPTYLSNALSDMLSLTMWTGKILKSREYSLPRRLIFNRLEYILAFINIRKSSRATQRIYHTRIIKIKKKATPFAPWRCYGMRSRLAAWLSLESFKSVWKEFIRRFAELLLESIFMLNLPNTSQCLLFLCIFVPWNTICGNTQPAIGLRCALSSCPWNTICGNTQPLSGLSPEYLLTTKVIVNIKKSKNLKPNVAVLLRPVDY